MNHYATYSHELWEYMHLRDGVTVELATISHLLHCCYPVAKSIQLFFLVKELDGRVHGDQAGPL